MNRVLNLSAMVLLALLLQLCFAPGITLSMNERATMTRDKEIVILSDYTYHGPIEVRGDATFQSLATAEMWPGNGSISNPYIIEGLNFTGDTCQLSLTDVSFSIRITDCWFKSLTPHNVKETTLQDLFCIGIFLENCNYVEIDYSNFTGQFWGIRVYNANSTSITENRFTDCKVGTVLIGSSNSSFTNNLLVKAWLDMYGCLFGNVTCNEFVEGGIAIDGDTVQECTHTMQGNQINGKPFGYFVSIADTALDANSYGQICLVNGSRIAIEGASFNITPGRIDIKHSANCFVRNVNCSGIAGGITLGHSSNMTLKQVRCLDSWATGVFIDDCYNCSIHDSLLSGNYGDGIYVYDSIGTIINASTLVLNGYGVYCRRSSGVLVMSCSVEDNKHDGLYIIDTTMAVALNNSILNNDGVGLYHGSGNVFGFFTYNKLGWNGGGNAYDGGSYSQWDDAVSLGNNWSDYAIPPTYTIPGPAHSVDRYPRVIIDVMPPTIVTERNPAIVNSSVPASIFATVTDVSTVLEAILSYRVDGGPWSNITLEMGSTDRYWGGLIPTANNGSVVQYKVYAVDSHGNWGVSAILTYTVQDPTSSASTSPSTTTNHTGPDDNQFYWILILGEACAALVAIVVLVAFRFRSRR